MLDLWGERRDTHGKGEFGELGRFSSSFQVEGESRVLSKDICVSRTTNSPDVFWLERLEASWGNNRCIIQSSPTPPTPSPTNPLTMTRIGPSHVLFSWLLLSWRTKGKKVICCLARWSLILLANLFRCDTSPKNNFCKRGKRQLRQWAIFFPQFRTRRRRLTAF